MRENNIEHIRKYLTDSNLKNEFERWYRKYRLVITDLVIVRRISTYIREELEDIKKREIELSQEIKRTIAESWIEILDKLDIDRYSILRGELNGLNRDVLDILLIIFPNVRHYSRKPFTTIIKQRQRRSINILRIDTLFRNIKRNISAKSLFICILFILTIVSLVLMTVKNIRLNREQNLLRNVNPSYNITNIRRNATRHRVITVASEVISMKRNCYIIDFRQVL